MRRLSRVESLYPMHAHGFTPHPCCRVLTREPARIRPALADGSALQASLLQQIPQPRRGGAAARCRCASRAVVGSWQRHRRGDRPARVVCPGRRCCRPCVTLTPPSSCRTVTPSIGPQTLVEVSLGPHQPRASPGLALLHTHPPSSQRPSPQKDRQQTTSAPLPGPISPAPNRHA